MLLFGVKSPLAVDYEEALARLGMSPRAVFLGGADRLLDRSIAVALEDLDPVPRAISLSPLCVYADRTGAVGRGGG